MAFPKFVLKTYWSKVTFFSLLWDAVYALCVLISCSVVCNSLWPCGLCSLPGSSVHGILQARILEWVAIPISRVSSQPRDWTQVSCIAGIFIIWATREAQKWEGSYPKIRITWMNESSFISRSFFPFMFLSNRCSPPLWNSACLFSGAGKTENLEREHQTRNKD